MLLIKRSPSSPWKWAYTNLTIPLGFLNLYQIYIVGKVTIGLAHNFKSNLFRAPIPLASVISKSLISPGRSNWSSRADVWVPLPWLLAQTRSPDTSSSLLQWYVIVISPVNQAPLEPLGFEHLILVPVLWVSPHCPCIEHHLGLCRNLLSFDFILFYAFSRDQ